MTAAPKSLVPVVDYLEVDGDAVRLVARSCTSCGAIFIGRRNGCASCGSTDFEARTLAPTGTIRSFTIVFRAPPPAQPPYVAVVVDHDGGGTVKGNLIGVEPSPEAVPVGAAVRIVSRQLGTDAAGSIAVGFAYELISD